MARLFLAFAQADLAVATELRSSLEACGYLIWYDPRTQDPQSISFRRSTERGILGSTAVVLVWSGHARQDEWVEQQLLFAQWMRRPIFLVLLDTIAVPDFLVPVGSPIWWESGAEAVSSLRTSRDFPAAQGTHPFEQLCEQVTHEHLRVRKEAVTQAAAMLKQGQYREELLALLEYLAEHDIMMGVREKAEEVLRADAEAHLTSAQIPGEIFLSNTPLAESETTITLEIISEEGTLRAGEEGYIYEGKISLNPQSVPIYALPPLAESEKSLIWPIKSVELDSYLIIIPFSLHEGLGKNYYEKVKFSVELTTPGAIAFDLFPKNISVQVNGPTYYTVSSHLRIEEASIPAKQAGAPISFTTLYPQITSFGEGEGEFYWLYRGNEQHKEVPPGTKHVLIVLRVPRGTHMVDGTIRWEIVVSKYVHGLWRSVNCKEGFLPLHWELGEGAVPFPSRQEAQLPKRFKLFYAYASEDEKFQKELEKQLSTLRRRGWIQEWRAHDVKAGRPRTEINDFLTRSDIILVLISANFLASDELYEQQLEPALKMHRDGKAQVIPILLRPVDWQDETLSQLVVLPRNKKPVELWSNQTVAFAEIASEIRAVIEHS